MNNGTYGVFMKQLRKFFDTDKIYNMEDAAFAAGLKKQLLYPTDVTVLSRAQFDALTSVVAADEKLYALSDGYNAGLESPKEGRGVTFFALKEIPQPFDYDEYAALTSSDMVILFSDSFRWVMILSELPQNGFAVLAGEDDFVSRFAVAYPRVVAELIDCTEYLIDLCQSENLSLDVLRTILGLLK